MYLLAWSNVLNRQILTLCTVSLSFKMGFCFLIIFSDFYKMTFSCMCSTSIASIIPNFSLNKGLGIGGPFPNVVNNRFYWVDKCLPMSPVHYRVYRLKDSWTFQFFEECVESRGFPCQIAQIKLFKLNYKSSLRKARTD